jgi:hypothetical protein
MEQQTQLEYYRGRIKEMLRRVPASVNSGSYDNAVAFKKMAAQASKVANQPRPKLEALMQVHNQLSAYY